MPPADPHERPLPRYVPVGLVEALNASIAFPQRVEVRVRADQLGDTEAIQLGPDIVVHLGEHQPCAPLLHLRVQADDGLPGRVVDITDRTPRRDRTNGGAPSAPRIASHLLAELGWHSRSTGSPRTDR